MDAQHAKLIAEHCGKPELEAMLMDERLAYFAMHEAEKLVMEPSQPHLSSPQEPDFYLDNLRKVTGGKLMNHEGLTTLSHGSFLPIVNATAAQRAEAFLKCIGKWV